MLDRLNHAPAPVPEAASRHRGVTYVAPKWCATFRYAGNRVWLGAFPSRRQAALAVYFERQRLGLPPARGSALCVSRQRGHWTARISIGGKRVHLGRFATAEEASAAYDAALARKRRGALATELDGD